MSQVTQIPILREMNQSDWLAFAGAEGWHNEQPLIAEGHLNDGTAYVLVLDRTGGCLILDDEQAEYGGYQLERSFCSQASARLFAYDHLSVPTKASFLAAGFEVV